MADETEFFVVVMNDEQQYSIWPVTKDLPAGWNKNGEPDSRENCLARIDREWSDLRPASLRRTMQG